MSNETDIAALNDLLVGVEMDRHSLTDGNAKVEALGRAIARLRGEAAQNFMGMPVVVDESMPADAIRVVAAAPAPVAGDSVLREDWIGDELEKLRNLRSSIGASDELGEAYNLSCYRFIGKIEAAYDKGGES